MHLKMLSAKVVFCLYFLLLWQQAEIEDNIYCLINALALFKMLSLEIFIGSLQVKECSTMQFNYSTTGQVLIMFCGVKEATTQSFIYVNALYSELLVLSH